MLFINDLADDVDGHVKIYADMKIYRHVNTSNDHHTIQADLEKLLAWSLSEKWQLCFNEQKCKVMHLGKQLEE